VLKVWAKFQRGYELHTQGGLTAATRVEAATAWREFAAGCEEHLGITACTIALHLVAVEVDPELDYLGPVPESMASWVERLNLRVVEPVRRRRVCQSPETAIVRAYLLETFVEAHRRSVLETSPAKVVRDADLLDSAKEEPKVGCISRSRLSFPS
jgi:hypothetical protein